MVAALIGKEGREFIRVEAADIVLSESRGFQRVILVMRIAKGYGLRSVRLCDTVFECGELREIVSILLIESTTL